MFQEPSKTSALVMVPDIVTMVIHSPQINPIEIIILQEWSEKANALAYMAGLVENVQFAG